MVRRIARLCENACVPILTDRDLKSFRKELLVWFREFRRDLPWRRTKDPYAIWVSEIMLQQTRVAAVVPYYERFLERFPTILSLAEAPEEEVLRLWSGLGYYSRARNLQRAAQQIVALHGGEFPGHEKAVQGLPGIGDYTGAAILSIAFGEQRAVLDGNVARVLARLGAIRGDLRPAKRWRALQETASDLLEPKSPGDWNQAMMELGATLCTPRQPQCLLCPVAKFCRARQLGDPESYPEKRKKPATVEITLAAAVLCDPKGNTLLLPPPPRQKGKSAADDVATLVSAMWHFPTVAVRSDPLTQVQKLLSELLPRKRKNLQFEPLGKVRHAVTYRSITIFPFRAKLTKVPRLNHAEVLPLEEFATLPVSNLTRKIARAALSAAHTSQNLSQRPQFLLANASNA